MPAKRLSLRKIKEVLRLKWSKRLRQTADCQQLRNRSPHGQRIPAPGGVGRVDLPLPASLDDTRLERLLFPPPPHLPAPVRGIPDWARAHQELKQRASPCSCSGRSIGPPVESTTGAVVGRHNPIYTHSVSSRRAANRTCGFPASGSLQDHAFAHGGSRAGADGRTRRHNVLGARWASGESPCRPSHASGATTGGADHGPERRPDR